MSRALMVAGILVYAVCRAAGPGRDSTFQVAQYGPQQNISVGSILVANEKLGDPNFAESVVLILQHDQQEGTLGVVINRQSEVPLSRLFPNIKHASSDPIYLGGPVGITIAQALLRLRSKTDDATPVSGDVYVTASKKLIEKSVASGAQASKFRLFLGYAGWAPGQLEAEIRVGAWSVLRGQSKIIFDGEPDSLWQRLNRETHWQMAQARSLQRFQIEKAGAQQPSCGVEVESVAHLGKSRASMTTVEHNVIN